MYYGRWQEKLDVASDFADDYTKDDKWHKIPLEEVMEADILFAAYEYEDYDGHAIVIFRQGGDLYEVHGSHCSCYELEGQWKPEKVDTEVLLRRIDTTDYGIIGKYNKELKKAITH